MPNMQYKPVSSPRDELICGLTFPLLNLSDVNFAGFDDFRTFVIRVLDHCMKSTLLTVCFSHQRSGSPHSRGCMDSFNRCCPVEKNSILCSISQG
ncbi:hypothetical protein SLA2020_190000 [Shorea laevis]